MNLQQLVKTVSKSKKRIGRGLGSGKGKTGGRGTKGQKARGKIALGFIGGTLPLYKKIPFKRGLGNPKRSRKLIPISLSKLSKLEKNTNVDLQALIEAGIVRERDVKKRGVKITGEGEIKFPANVKLPVAKQAAEKIEKAGGKIIRG